MIIGNGKNTSVAEAEENGYKRVKAGRFNTYAINGDFYMCRDVPAALSGLKTLIGSRLNDGGAFGEDEHPVMEKGMDMKAYVNRLAMIDSKMVSIHISHIEYIKTNKTEVGFENFPIYEIYAWVKPHGPRKHIVEDTLNNPLANFYLSLRSLVTNVTHANVACKDVIAISTYDSVQHAGMDGSSQWNGDKGTSDGNLNSSPLEVCVDGSCVAKYKDMLVSEGLNSSDIEKLISSAVIDNTNPIFKF